VTGLLAGGFACGARWTLERAHGTERDGLTGVDATTGSAGPSEAREGRRAA
jgi:hypothetical protein